MLKFCMAEGKRLIIEGLGPMLEKQTITKAKSKCTKLGGQDLRVHGQVGALRHDAVLLLCCRWWL